MASLQLARIVACVAVACVAISPAVLADEPASPLSGPYVKEPGVPGNSTRFTGGGRREGERVVDHRTFLKALDDLRNSPDSAIRLSPDQDAQVFVLVRDYRLLQRAYFERNLNDIRDVRQSLDIRGDQPPTESAIRRGVDELRRSIVGDDPTNQQAMSDEAVKEAAREKARRIYEGAPRATEVHARIWKVLSAPQRDALTDTINSLVAQQEALRREFLSPEAVASGMMTDQAMSGGMNSAMSASSMSADSMRGASTNRTVGAMDAQASKAEASADPASLLGTDPSTIAPDDPRLPERVRRRIRFMKPEARTEALSRYLVDLKSELAESKAAAEKDKSAAPTVDKVNIPTPEKK
ncbi:MAG: hypothetical protein KGS45_01150 [Planctomycetes bacterium]|nr:hypothetical protein [Planctomycetota bacterium]